MIAGESGILACCPPSERPIYKKGQRRLEWPNGAESLVFTADEPDRLRGKQHMKLWCDELASWRFPEAWDQAVFGLRLGTNPQALITLTPRPLPLVKQLLADPRNIVTTGTSYENRDNLSPKFFETIIKRYEGTRLGRQEIGAEVLDDNPKALWTRENIDKNRWTARVPRLERIVVAVDPGVSDSEDAAETGIIVAGVDQRGHAYILDDRSTKDTPLNWSSKVSYAYQDYRADRIIAESNNGGQMVEATIKASDPTLPVKLVHASRGKVTRAEPVSAMYEQGRVHHVGIFSALEDQLTDWQPGMPSPDRMDALVWAITELCLPSVEGLAVYELYSRRFKERKPIITLYPRDPRDAS
jgi:phage terminase large subunit-like protein